MDPLSITAAVVSFVDLAKRIKDSVDKIGQTRQNLQQLVENLMEELTELQKLCQDEQGRLTNIDPESTRSLEKLRSELVNILERCLNLTGQRGANKGLSSVKYHVIAWLKNTEIEGHILRVRKRVSSIHRRFTIITSLGVQRAVNELLVSTSDQRAKLSQLESLLSTLLIDSHASGTFPASVLDRDSPDSFDYQFLHRQVRRVAALLSSISTRRRHTFTIEETRGPVPIAYQPSYSWSSKASLMRSTTVEALETLQLLELEPSNFALWEGAQHLIDLGVYLFDLGLEEDAAAIHVGTANIYQTLMKRNPSTYLPYVIWGLQRLSIIHFGTHEGLSAAKRTVDICREAAAMLQEDYSLYLANAMRLYSHYLAANNDLDEAFTYAAESLAMQRKAPTPQQEESDCVFVSWEASGEEHVAFTSARTISRPYEMALDDMLSLGIYARILRSMGRWSEALIIATEAVQCVDALGKCDFWDEDLLPWSVEVHEDHRYIVSRICSPTPPLVATISDVDDPDKVDNEDVPGEGGSSAPVSRSDLELARANHPINM